MEPTRCRDLHPGDILLKVIDKSPLSLLIGAAQAITGAARPFIVHAGLMFDRTYVVEAQSAGISANDLRVQNKKYTYVVYRPKRADLGRGAGTCAKMLFDIHQRQRNRTHTLQVGSKKKTWKTGGSMQYSAKGAAGSLFGTGGGTALAPGQMDDLLTDVLEGRSHRFFCSQLVIYVYQFVGAQCGMSPSAIFSGSDAKIHPSRLASMLSMSPHFAEQGVMLPNVR